MRGFAIVSLATAAAAAPLTARQGGLDESVAGLKLDEGLGGQVGTLLGQKDGGALGTALGPLLVGLLGAGVKTPGTRDLNARQAGLDDSDPSLAGLKLDEGLGGQVGTLLGQKDGGALGTALGPLLVGLLGAGVKTPGTRDLHARQAGLDDADPSLAGLELDTSLGGQVATLLGSKDGGALGTALGPLLTGLLGTSTVDGGVTRRQAGLDDADPSLAGLELDTSLGGQVATLLGSKDGGALGTALGPLLTGLLGTSTVDGGLTSRQAGLDDADPSLAGLELDTSLGGQVATLLGSKDGGALGTALAPLLTGLLGTSTVDGGLTSRQAGLDGSDPSLAGLELDTSLGGQVATLLGSKDGGALGTALAPLLTGLLGTSTVDTPRA
jgi:hypothetical protein